MRRVATTCMFFEPRHLMLSGEEVTLLAKEWLTEEKKLFVPASAKLVHHATLTERGP